MGISGIGSAPQVPAPVRDAGELYAPWKVVNNVENGHPVFVTTFETRTEIFDPAYSQALLQQLSDFVHLGKSSLTPYEAVTLGKAANINPAPASVALSNGQVEVGDRVQVSADNYDGTRRQSSGIIDAIDQDGNAWVMTDGYGSEKIDGKSLQLAGITAGALEDGRPV